MTFTSLFTRQNLRNTARSAVIFIVKFIVASTLMLIAWTVTMVVSLVLGIIAAIATLNPGTFLVVLACGILCCTFELGGFLLFRYCCKQ